MSKKLRAKKAQVRTDYGVSDEEFIRVWQAASSIDEVSEKTGMPKAICHARASGYRKKKIKLKPMPRRSKRGLDVERLNKLIEEIPPGATASDGKADHAIQSVLKKLKGGQ